MFAVRSARPDDHTAFVALFPELGVDEVVPGPEEWWATLGPQTLVIDDDGDGDVIAYIYFQVLAGTGYVRHVVVDPDHRGQALGLQLMNAVAGRLRAAGCTQWCLNVKPDNVAALGLYERLGMRTAYQSAVVRLAWDLVDRLPADNLSLVTCPIDPADDPALEAAHGLPAGQLANLRKISRRIDIRLADPAAPHVLGLGLASFDPTFPGAFPFRVARPASPGAPPASPGAPPASPGALPASPGALPASPGALARPLLVGLRAHALPGVDRVQLVIEDDDPLVQQLLAVGATLHLTLLHLRGPVPAV